MPTEEKVIILGKEETLREKNEQIAKHSKNLKDLDPDKNHVKKKQPIHVWEIYHYLYTFTKRISQMWVNIPYMDNMRIRWIFQAAMLVKTSTASTWCCGQLNFCTLLRNEK